MSQLIIDAFYNLGSKTEAEKRRRRKPGPEWYEPLALSVTQLIVTGIATAGNAHLALRDFNSVAAISALYNGYLLLKGIHNFRITKRSAEEEPSANNDLLTPKQSMSNSETLMSNTFSSLFIETAVLSGVRFWETGKITPVNATVDAVMMGATAGFSVWSACSARSNGPTRMPNWLGKLPQPPGSN